MNLARLASRVVVGGTAAALATAGLIGVTGPSASAATVVTTTYNCTTPFGSSFSADVDVDITVPPTAPAGFPVPAGLLSFNSHFVVDNAVAQGLGMAGVASGKSDDFAAAFGSTLAK